MGSFNQHVTCSTLTGIAIGGAAYHLGFSVPTCLLSGGLCSMAGMLPDIDSDSSRSFQECIYLAAGLCSVLLADRLRHFGLDRDIIMLSGAAAFMFVRFGVGEMIKKITAHRGMFHSIPAAVLSGEIVFFLSTGTVAERVFKGFALFAGYMSHLILDEICSIDSTGKTLRLKKSFGTALKLFDSKRMGTGLVLYAIVVFLGVTAVKKPEIIDDLDGREEYAESEPSPMEDFFYMLANLEYEAVSVLGGTKKESPVTATTANPTVPVVVNDRRYSESRLFSRLTGPSAPAERLVAVETPPVIPSPQAALNDTLQPTSLRTPVSPEPNQQVVVQEEPVRIPIREPNRAPVNVGAGAVPFGISGSDFGPRRAPYMPPVTRPAPVVVP